jgi:CheY-like chemotaxis protein
VIVISADATPQQTKHLLARGARSFLTTPIDVDDLLRQVAELLAFREPKA